MTVRVGVVGCGLVAQAMHLPYLAHLSDRFTLTALAEPSATVRAALAHRYSVSGHADYRELLDRGDLDAMVVCSPNATHADVVLTALEAGLHIFVEKPLCITLADADAIIAARDRARRVVQVGYMKRFDPAYQRMLAELPNSTAGLRYVRVIVNDPEFLPYFGLGDIVRGNDVPYRVIEAVQSATCEQVAQAVGSASPDVVTAFSDGYLGSLVHDVNLVHGLLERMGEKLPGAVVDGAWWADGTALTGSVRLEGGARWDNAWIQLLDIPVFRETISLFFVDSVRSLTFPSPWLKQSPTIYACSGAEDGESAVRSYESYRESFERELAHFHECINGAACLTPPEQARLDIQVLTSMFLQSRNPRER